MTSQQISLERPRDPNHGDCLSINQAKEVKEVVLVPDDQSKTTQIRADLDPK